MESKIHTVLGANGAIGKAVIKELEIRQLQIRKVSTKPTWVQADLLRKEEAEKAIDGSSYVYLCIGLPYNAKVWETRWPQIMQNVIDACEKAQAKLIFLDNIYMYASPLPIPFDESTSQNPNSKKGKARKQSADLMIKALRDNKIKGLIGRSADFYGEGAINSPFYISFLERMLQDKGPQTLVSADIEHTYADVLDNGRALVELALNDDCYGEVWHLPVGEPITTNGMLAIFNEKLGSYFKVSVMPTLLKKILAIFIPIIKEAKEMEYQFEQKYVMSDSKFRKRFPNFKVSSYQDGVNRMVEWFKVIEKQNASC
ncbi:NAD-dependent epimerase/dehydratase family protein [Flavobacteriaceae bacterium F89]|uniref:NAD-dependent epimerase/dehydratase family protein n=1 Tax=Cerina litoralis TaxID=2874477 RepID=A0AAE3JQS1_9FLAO|nr:NAD-dependent epimerase/dehydratase family protein [Cerina litoralis]MCG2462179.1 NAD-dependent epimerase/dehydratase family protein [Cerina litoralis]